MSGPDRIQHQPIPPTPQTANIKSVGELHPGDLQRTMAHQADETLEKMDQRKFDINVKQQNMQVGVPTAKDLPTPAPKNSPVNYASQAQAMQHLTEGAIKPENAGSPKTSTNSWWPPQAENIFAVIFKGNYETAVAMQNYVTSAWNVAITMNKSLINLGTVAGQTAYLSGQSQANQLHTQATQSWIGMGISIASAALAVVGMGFEGAGLAQGLRNTAEASDALETGVTKGTDEDDNQAIEMKDMEANNQRPENPETEGEKGDEAEAAAKGEVNKNVQADQAKQADMRQKGFQKYEQAEKAKGTGKLMTKDEWNKTEDVRDKQYQEYKAQQNKLNKPSSKIMSRQKWGEWQDKWANSKFLRKAGMAIKEGFRQDPNKAIQGFGQLMLGSSNQPGVASAVNQSEGDAAQKHELIVKAKSDAIDKQITALQQVTGSYASQTESNVKTEQDTVTARIRSINQMIDAITQGYTALFRS